MKNEKPRKIEKIKNLKVGLGAKFCLDSEYEKKKMVLSTNLTVIPRFRIDKLSKSRDYGQISQ